MSARRCTVCVHALDQAAKRGALVPCIAGPSRLGRYRPVPAGLDPAGKSSTTVHRGSRGIATLHAPRPEAVPFFGQPIHATPPAYLNASEKRRSNGPGRSDEDMEKEVDDREWEMRVARAMIHLRETLPHLFDPQLGAADLFPPDIYSRNVVLKLPAPLPLKISSLAGYSMAYGLAKSGMSAFHTDLRTSLDRLTFSPSPAAASAPAASFFTRRVPAHRHKQIRVLLGITGSPRLPPHNVSGAPFISIMRIPTGYKLMTQETQWHTSSVYTFSPYSGLISSHEVETIRPLPGEGVADWLMSRLLGWTGRHGQLEGGAMPVPSRAVVVPRDDKIRRNRR